MKIVTLDCQVLGFIASTISNSLTTHVELVLSKQQFWYQSVRIQYSTVMIPYLVLFFFLGLLFIFTDDTLFLLII